MPANISVCRNGGCRVYGYDVSVSAGTAANEIAVALIDACNTLSDACRVKSILTKALIDYLENEGLPTDGLNQCQDTFCVSSSSTAVVFYMGQNRLVYTGAGVGNPATQTVNVQLPFTCDNVFA